MTMTDTPAVKIGTTTISNDWTTTERIALGGLKITWGRQSHLDKARAAQLYLEVLDTDGHLSSATHLTGQPITVTRADGRVIFRGRVDDYKVALIRAQDPNDGHTRRVWKLSLTAGCKLAELGQTVLPGPGNDPALVPDRGPNYWDTGTPGARLAQLNTQGLDGIVDAVSYTSPYEHTPRQPILRWRPFSDRMSAREHLEAIYQTIPLGYVEYRPFNNSVRVGTPTETSGLALKYVDGVLRIDFLDGAAGRAIPARTIAMPNGYEASTGILDAIDVVQVTSPGHTGGEFTYEHETAHASELGGYLAHSVSNDVMVMLDTAADVGDFEWPFPLDYVTSEWGTRPGIGSGFHTGIDLAGGPAILGADVHAAGPGTYVGSRTHPDWGNNVIIDHGDDVNGDRLRTVYCHLENPPTLTLGQPVAKGDTIGQLGNTGMSTGAHLHFETLVNGDDINPRKFMSQRQYGQNQTDTYHDAWQTSLAADTAELLNQINGRLHLPQVRFDWRHFEYADTVTESMIDTYRWDDRALYFIGSVFNVAMDAAAAHTAIGGTLVYHKGWTHDVTLAPAIVTGTDSLTIDELCESDVPTLADFDPDITLADLGNLSHGVPED